MSEGKELVERAIRGEAIEPQPSQLPAIQENYLNPNRYDQIGKLANVFAKSDLVPPHFRGKPENCFIALQMAFRSQIDPMVALQNLYLIQGKPGMSAQLAIALANRSGLLKGPIRFEEAGSGEGYTVTAKATTREGYDIAAKVSMKMAKDEGWTRNPKYQTMGDLMLRYRAATFLVRQHMPEVLLGMQTSEELTDVAASKGVVDPVRIVDTPAQEPVKSTLLAESVSEPPATTKPKKTKPEPILSQPAASSEVTKPEAAVAEIPFDQAPAMNAGRSKAQTVVSRLIGANGHKPEVLDRLKRLEASAITDADSWRLLAAVKEANAGRLADLDHICSKY